MKEAFAKGGNQVEYHDYYKYRISYISEKNLDLIFLFVTGLTDVFDNIKKELIKCKKEFLNLFEDILQHKYDSKTFEVFDPTVDSIHRNLRPKISLVGFSGVGKTTITRLIKAEEIPMQHIPTITGDIATIRIGKLHFHLWDFAGQEQFSYLWNNFIKGSDAVLLITDSTLENVEKSKFFLELIKEQAPNAHSSIIANKQDLEDAMSPNQVENIIGLKTYSMIAKDENNRDKMITIIADILEMNAEVSPLLKPLLERDNLIELATNALNNAEFEKAASHFEQISDLCIELGDDSLGREFYEKGTKIREMLKKVKTSQPVPKEEPTAPKPEIQVDKELKKEQVASVKRSGPPPIQPVPVKSEKEAVEPKEELIKKEPQKEVVSAEDLSSFPMHPKPLEPKKVSTGTQEKGPLITPVVPPSFKIVKGTELKREEPQTIETPSTGSDMSVPKPKGFIKIETEKPLASDSNKAMIKEKEPISGKLDLKPEDFMVKQRPKTVIAVPKDAKEKLKTSPFAQVTNPTETNISKPASPTGFIKKDMTIPSKPPQREPFTVNMKGDSLKPPYPRPIPSKAIEIPKEKTQPLMPKSPTELISSKPVNLPTTPTTFKPTVTFPSEITPPSYSVPGQMDPQQKASLEQTLMDLKIKKANLSKMALDFDMKELTGDINGVELEEKKKRLIEIEAKINQQIKDLEKLLGQ